MRRKIYNLLLLPLVLILFNVSCEKEPYTPSMESRFAIYSILDPSQPIEVYIWKSTTIGQLADTASGRIIEILENRNLIFHDTIFTDYLNTSIFPIIGNEYTFNISDVENKVRPFESRSITTYYPPEILSYTTNDSAGSLGPSFSQTLQQIEIVTDQSTNDSPYYAYQMIADSLPREDDKPVDLTAGWFRRSGYTCPEIAESPYIDNNYRIINLTCFEEENLFSIESSNHRPGDIDYVRFTLCNFDEHTMEFARWIYQNSFLQEEIDITQIFNTKDDFSNETGYDFILNRTCNEFILDFN